MDDNKSYLETKRKEFFEQHAGDDKENEWNIIRSQINSGLFLGLAYEQIDKYALADISYEQREIIKFAMYTKLPEKQIDMLINSAIKNSANDELTLKEFENYRFMQLQDVSQLEKYQQLCDLLQKQNHSEEIQEYKEQVNELEKRLNDKEKEILNIRAQYDKIVEEYESKLQTKTLISHNENEDELAAEKQKKKFLIFKKHKKKEYGQTKLPEDFNFVKYIAKKKLSSSQLELVTIAVKLNVSESAIYDIVESGAGADQMKQMIEAILARQDQAQKLANDVPVDNISLFTKISD